MEISKILEEEGEGTYNHRFLNLIIINEESSNSEIKHSSDIERKKLMLKIGLPEEILNYLSIGFPKEYSDGILEQYNEYNINDIIEIFYSENTRLIESPSEKYNKIKEEFEYLVQIQKINNFFKNHE